MLTIIYVATLQNSDIISSKFNVVRISIHEKLCAEMGNKLYNF